MAKSKKEDQSARDVQAESQEALEAAAAGTLKSENEAYFHYRLTGANEFGYVEATRDQEPDVAPEYGVAPHPDLFNPRPSDEMRRLGIARAANDGRQQPLGFFANSPEPSAPIEEKEDNADEYFESEVRPNVELTGAGEDGNLTEDASLPADVQRVVIVDESDVKADSSDDDSA